MDMRALEIWEKLEKQEDGAEGYRLKGDILYYGELVYVMKVPGLWKEILGHFHNSKEGGHSSWLRTYLKVKYLFY